MKLSTLLFVAMSGVFADPSRAAEPNLSFDLNSDSESYSFKIENTSASDIVCKSIEVKAPIGKGGCSETASHYVYTIENKRILKATVILNSTFGLDYLHNLNKTSKSAGFVYCDQPQFKLDCK